MIYLLVRVYKDGRVWATTGTKTRIEYLHSYCSGKSYTDKIYLIASDGIYKQEVILWEKK